VSAPVGLMLLGTVAEPCRGCFRCVLPMARAHFAEGLFIWRRSDFIWKDGVLLGRGVVLFGGPGVLLGRGVVLFGGGGFYWAEVLFGTK
jgi:hypothetical protein